MLENLFLTIVKMSATASLAAVAVILLRQLAGRKLPRTFNYAAWVIVLIRLLIPFSVQSGFSLFNIVESPAAAIDRATIDRATLDRANVAAGQGNGSIPYGTVDNEDGNNANNTVITGTGLGANANTLNSEKNTPLNNEGIDVNDEDI